MGPTEINPKDQQHMQPSERPPLLKRNWNVPLPRQDLKQGKHMSGQDAGYMNLGSGSSALFPNALIWHSHPGDSEWPLPFFPIIEYLDIDYANAELLTVGLVISLFFLVICSYRNSRRDATLMTDNLITELRQSELRYQILVEQSSDAVLLFDLETLALDEVNLHFCQMFGYSYEQSRQLLLTDVIFTPEPEIHCNLQRLIDGGYNGLEEQVFRTCDGTLLDVELSKTVVQVGLKKKVIVIVRDISSRKRAEAERDQMERQLQQAQKMEALGQLTGGIAHDFNNILAVIQGYSNLALTRYATDKDSTLAHYLEEVIKASERARDMVACLLTYSRSQTDEVAAAMAPAPLVKEVIKMFTSTIPSGIQLQEQIDADAPAVCMTPGELHQIVMNLVINARDAMAEYGRLDIRLSTLAATPEFCTGCKQAKSNALCPGKICGEYVSLSVTDTGCGISPENFKLIFDPFFTTKAVGKGTGLGLSVIHGIVRRSGGCVIVDSQLGIGSTIQVLFPAADSSVNLPIAVTPLAVNPDGNGARILVVDDESALAQYLADLLEGENYVVDVYTDPVKALNYFRANPQRIDAVITDQTMPNKSGIEIAGVMLTLRPDLPVFLCSGYSDSIDEDTQFFGIRRFFNKPVNATELLIALDEEITYSTGI